MSAEWREVTGQQTLVFEKRGRMLRRAKRFDRPRTYERTIYVKTWVRGDDVTFHFTITPGNRVRPGVSCSGAAEMAPPALQWLPA